MDSYSKMISESECRYKEYCDHLVEKFNREIVTAGAHSKSEAYKKAKAAFDSDPLRLLMVESIAKMYFVRPNPQPIFINTV